MIFSLISRNIAGQTKKSSTLALTFVFWAAGNMTAPQIFQSKDAPRYRKGFTAHFCLYVLFNITLVITRILLVHRNKDKRNAALLAEAAPAEVNEVTKADETITHSHAFDDLTDRENPDFRYEL